MRMWEILQINQSFQTQFCTNAKQHNLCISTVLTNDKLHEQRLP